MVIKMKVEKTIDAVRAQVKAWKKEGLTVGFVPTMGYLHEGHKSLITRAVAENDRVVVSIFVNPIQFGPKEDLSTYPRDLAADTVLCEDAGAALIFAPEVSEMYADDFTTFVDTSGVSQELCGKSRPIHFRGVCTVVNKLFNIVTPDCAYFGEKDAQQLAVIRRMVRDLSMDVKIVGCPIIREEDGLAKSSRNTYLSAEERKAELMALNEMEGGIMFKMKDDPRVTKVGKFIRKCSIDELPQFFNVFAGTMSLVGTRPPTVDEVEKYERDQWRRISIKPGITGMWQVNGRSNVKTFEEVVQMDVEYIDNWSIFMDFKILLKTVAVLFKHEGAY